jgi:hypothetical protein
VPERHRTRWGCLLVLIVSALAALFGWRTFERYVAQHPEQFPWTELSLTDPVGPFTASKLAALTGNPLQCRNLLDLAGDRDRPAPPITSEAEDCGYNDGMILRPDDDQAVTFAPGGLITSCPVAAAMRLWEPLVQRAAARNLGSRVVRIEHFGSYSCRRLYGREGGRWSEHATADAVDIAGFRLADGRRVTIAADWAAEGRDALFLREVRDSACDLFATVLSPDYNEAHRDHLHFDQAERGARGGRLCR